MDKDQWPAEWLWTKMSVATPQDGQICWVMHRDRPHDPEVCVWDHGGWDDERGDDVKYLRDEITHWQLYRKPPPPTH